MRRLLLAVSLAWVALISCSTTVDATDITVVATPPPVAPVVVANNATNITSISAILHGNITDTGGVNCTLRGFEWGDSTGNYTCSWNESGNFGASSFSHQLGSLNTCSQVFWRAIAVNSVGQSNSTELDFWTLCTPGAPTNFTATQTGVSSANLTWTKGAGATLTIIRAGTVGYPQTPTEGYDVYNGTDNWTSSDGLALDFATYYYTAWSWNGYGYSIDYAQTSIGGANMIMFGLLILPLAFTGFYFWKREIWQGLVACLCWLAAAIFFMTQSAGANPFDVADIWMVLFWICMVLAIVFALSPFVFKPAKEESWEEGEDEVGQPIMVHYVKGNETGRSRGLTDIEVRNREQRIKEQATKPKIKPSNFAQNGKIS